MKTSVFQPLEVLPHQLDVVPAQDMLHFPFSSKMHCPPPIVLDQRIVTKHLSKYEVTLRLRNSRDLTQRLTQIEMVERAILNHKVEGCIGEPHLLGVHHLKSHPRCKPQRFSA